MVIEVVTSSSLIPLNNVCMSSMLSIATPTFQLHLRQEDDHYHSQFELEDQMQRLIRLHPVIVDNDIVYYFPRQWKNRRIAASSKFAAIHIGLYSAGERK